MILRDLLFDNYTLSIVTLGCGALGLVSGALGTFAVLRKQSLLGDAISHAALPGVAIAFLLTHSKEPLLLGAAAAGWIGTLLVMSIVRTTRIKYDSALALMLSVFFGAGLMLKTVIQRLPDASQAGMDRFVFGQAATLILDDVILIAALGALALSVMLIFWKEFKLLSFDPDFGASLGFPMKLLDVLLTSLLVIAIVAGLQAVGAMLMSALIVAPAAAARQWTDRLGWMAGLSALFGALAGVSGVILSDTLSTRSIPTGPTITLSASALVVVSLLFAPNRGLLWTWVYDWRNRRRLRLEAVLEDLYELSLQHESLDHGHTVAVLQTMSVGGVLPGLRELEARGWARRTAAQEWALTPAGKAEAERLARSR